MRLKELLDNLDALSADENFEERTSEYDVEVYDPHDDQYDEVHSVRWDHDRQAIVING